MEKIILEGIVLRSIDYLKSQKIVTLLTKDHGLITMMVHGVSSRNLTKFNLCSPLTRGTFQTEKGSSNFYIYRDGALLDLHLFLRSDWRALQCACDLVKAILKSQLFEKSSPLLYELLITYLSALKEPLNFDNLKASFLLKILKHEGLYHSEIPCCSSSESDLISHLAEARHFKEIERVEISKELQEKIALFFETCVS